MQRGRTELDKAVRASTLSVALTVMAFLFFFTVVLGRHSIASHVIYILGGIMLWSMGAAMGQLAAYLRARRLSISVQP